MGRSGKAPPEEACRLRLKGEVGVGGAAWVWRDTRVGERCIGTCVPRTGAVVCVEETGSYK